MADQMIGFTGWGRSGKDSAAKCLAKRLGWKHLAFADPLREYLLKIDPYVQDAPGFGWSKLSQVIDRIGWDAAKEEYPEVRPLMQRLGHTLRDDDAYYWVKQLFNKLPDGNIAFSDVRCMEEWYAITGAGGKVYRIVRPGYEAANVFELQNHALTEVSNQIPIIENDGTLADLCKKVCDIAAELGN